MRIGSKVRQGLALLASKGAGGFHILENSVLCVGVFLVAALVTLQAVLRYTMHAMPLGIEESALLTAVWVYFIGIAVAMRDRKQINVTLLRIFPIPHYVHKRIDIITNFLTFAVCGIFAYFAIVWCQFVPSAGIQLAPFYITANVSYLSFAVGLTLASIYSLIQLIRKLQGK